MYNLIQFINREIIQQLGINFHNTIIRNVGNALQYIERISW